MRLTIITHRRHHSHFYRANKVCINQLLLDVEQFSDWPDSLIPLSILMFIKNIGFLSVFFQYKYILRFDRTTIATIYWDRNHFITKRNS